MPSVFARALLCVALWMALPATALGQAWMSDLDGAGQCAAAKSGTSTGIHATSVASPYFDATYYHLTLDVRFDPNYLYASTRIEGRAKDAPLDTLVLDFDDAMVVDSVLSSTGTTLSFTHAGDALRIPLPAPVDVGAAVAVDVYYEGLPVPDGFGTFVFGTQANGDPYAWTLSEPYNARGWWPSKDHPSDKADSVRITVTVPEAMRVGSEGLLVAETPNGDGTTTYDWLSHYPTATYLVSIAAGVYDVTEDMYVRPDSLAAEFGALSMPVLQYAYRGTNVYDGGDEYSGWKNVLDVLPVLEYWYGPYPFSEEKYGHAHVTFGGGMEHQTMSSLGGAGIGLVAHELGHMWFGDAVTTRTWPHLWLNEGFATLTELLYWKARADTYPGVYEQIFDLYYGRAQTAEGTLVVEDTTSLSNLFAHTRVYSKGWMVLRMLRGMVGDETFRAILQAYSADPAVRFGTAESADFERVAQAVSGLDLTTFFRQWVTEGTGRPDYTVNWSVAPAVVGFDVSVTVSQLQEMPDSNFDVFEMPVTLAIQTEAGETSFTVTDDQRTQTFVLHVDDLPTGIILDPDRWILRGTDVLTVGTESPPAESRETRIASVYPNPTPGAFHVRYHLATPGPVRFDLFDVRGRRIARLFGGFRAAGAHDDAFEVPDLAGGIYFIRMTTTDGVRSRAVTRRDD